MSYLRIVLLSLLLGAQASAGVLEQEVAWSGTMRKVTVGEVFAKMKVYIMSLMLVGTPYFSGETQEVKEPLE